MQSSSEQPLVGEERYVTTRITAAKETNCSHTFRSAEMSYVLARCGRGKIKANNMAEIEEEILLQANLFLLLVLKRRQVSFKT